MRKMLEMSIVYNLVESNVLRMLDELEFVVKSNEIIDKLEIDDDMIDEDVLLYYLYLLDDKNMMLILIEEERIRFVKLEKDSDKVMNMYILDNDNEELNELMYF